MAFAPSDHTIDRRSRGCGRRSRWRSTVWTYLHMRRDLTGPGRWLVTTALVLLAAASVGAGVGNVATDSFADTYPAPGTILSVGDHDLHLDCRGQGQPTVVLVSGLGEFSASWARILDGVAPTTRVCAYDRAGQGWSDDVERPPGRHCCRRGPPRTARGRRGDRARSCWSGHSIGGPYAMTYADQYADEVAGHGAAGQHQPPPVRRDPQLPDASTR